MMNRKFFFVGFALILINHVDSFSQQNGSSNLYGGKLYGVTHSGGTNNGGVIFQTAEDGSDFNLVWNFDDGRNGQIPNFLNGAWPAASGLVLADNGKLYGTTYYGGINSNGIIYEWDPSELKFTKKHDFEIVNGGFPWSGMAVSRLNSKLFGTTFYGANQLSGVLYEYDYEADKYEKKIDLGVYGYSNLTEGDSGVFYGTTYSDGNFSQGTLFEFDQRLNLYTVLHNFGALGDGSYPYGGVVKASNGKLYGTTTAIGSHSSGGVLYEFDPVTKNYQIKFDFSSQSMGEPMAALVQHANGKLYGTTNTGGANGYGTLFEFDLLSGVVSKKIDFDSLSNGAHPWASLTRSSNGKLYGVTSSGGTYGMGVLFEYDPIEDAFQKKHDFDGQGAGPIASLLFVKDDQKITFGSLDEINFETRSLNLTASTSSGLPVTFSSSDPTIAAISGSVVTILKAGTVIITARQNGNVGINPAQEVKQTLIIAKANQSITFDPLPAKKFGDSSFNLRASASSGLPISFTSSDPSIALVIENTVTILKAGIVTITAEQFGDSNYNAAEAAEQILTVNKTDQTIMFPSQADKTFGDLPFYFYATINSDLPITFISQYSKVSIDGTQATIISAGRESVVAVQPGNENYNPAQSEVQSFCIDPAKPTITQNIVNGKATLTSSSMLGNQWYLDGIAIGRATDKTILVNEPGEYSVQVIIDNCASDFSDMVMVVVTGKIDLPIPIRLYPNPADNSIQLSGVDQMSEVFLFDILGKRQQIQFIRESNCLRADVQHLSAGVYEIRLSSENNIYIFKFVKL